jgi:hypothetical protein
MFPEWELNIKISYQMLDFGILALTQGTTVYSSLQVCSWHQMVTHNRTSIAAGDIL